MNQITKEQIGKAFDVRFAFQVLSQVIVLGIGIAGSAWWAAGTLHEFDKSVIALGTSIKELGDSVKNKAKLLDKDLETMRAVNERQDAERQAIIAEFRGRVKDRYTRRDQYLWCLNAEKDNPNFKCPNPFELPGADVSPQ